MKPEDTPTPRTDAAERKCHEDEGYHYLVEAEFARELERELAEMQTDRDRERCAHMGFKCAHGGQAERMAELERENAALLAALEMIQRIGETELAHTHPTHGSAPHKVALLAKEALDAGWKRKALDKASPARSP